MALNTSISDDTGKIKQESGTAEGKVIINNTYNGNEIQIFNSDRKEKFNNFKKQQTEILGQTQRVSDTLLDKAQAVNADSLG